MAEEVRGERKAKPEQHIRTEVGWLDLDANSPESIEELDPAEDDIEALAAAERLCMDTITRQRSGH